MQSINLIRLKLTQKKKGPKMNLLYLRFWSDNLIGFTARSPMADSDRQTNKWGDQNLREKGEKGKMKLLKRWWLF